MQLVLDCKLPVAGLGAHNYINHGLGLFIIAHSGEQMDLFLELKFDLNYECSVEEDEQSLF